jgi:pimeloyl-ACP methyl ester carboxylesterase
MTALYIILIIVAVLLLGGLIAMFCYTYPISKRVYREQLVRTDVQKWGRVCSAPDNEEQLAMWNSGIEWAEQNHDFMTEVDIENDGFHLYGEYYDFGAKRCVIILPGRCESLVYSYYFASPYKEAGFNVLVIDTRCHGKSDGTYNTIGVKESSDVIAWSKLMHERFGNKEIYYHGICIGTASAIFALTSRDCPDYVKGFVTEGCFVSFRETFKRHMIADKRPLFPVLDLVMLHINRHTKTNVYKDKPISAIKKLKPDMRVLFLYGKKDIFSIPQKSQNLFDSCAATDKKLVWFEKGGHSHLRINNRESYDNAIIDFFRG